MNLDKFLNEISESMVNIATRLRKIEGKAVGDVTGPSVAVVDGDLALFDGITGKYIKGGGLPSARLASLSGIDMKTVANSTIFTVPVGKALIIDKVVVRNATVSLAGGTSYSFTNFRSAVDLSSMTTPATDYMVIRGSDVTKYSTLVAGANFQIIVTTGSTLPSTATVDLFGYLI